MRLYRRRNERKSTKAPEECLDSSAASLNVNVADKMFLLENIVVWQLEKGGEALIKCRKFSCQMKLKKFLMRKIKKVFNEASLHFALPQIYNVDPN